MYMKPFHEVDFEEIEARMHGRVSETPDPHRETAADIFGVSAHSVSEKMRDVGKAINFLVIYGARGKTVVDP